jgi:hypothetical protein
MEYSVTFYTEQAGQGKFYKKKAVILVNAEYTSTNVFI